MIDALKKLLDAVGLVPAILGLFSVTPRWFRPTRYLEPDIEYAAAGLAFLVFIVTVLYMRRHGAPTTWAPATTRRHLTEGIVAVVLAIAVAAVYVWVVRTYPGASTNLDLLQIALWSAVFGLASFFFTAFAYVFKAP